MDIFLPAVKCDGEMLLKNVKMDVLACLKAQREKREKEEKEIRESITQQKKDITKQK